MSSDQLEPGKFNKEIGKESITSKLGDEESHALDLAQERRLKDQKIVWYELRNEAISQNRRERKLYAKLIFALTAFWILSILFILIADGFAWHGFHLSDAVLLGLITTTTFNIFGFFLWVTRYLFNPKDLEHGHPFEK